MAQNGFVFDSNGALLLTLAADIVAPQRFNGFTFDGVTGALLVTDPGGSGSIPDGTYGDIDVTDSGATWTVRDGYITTAQAASSLATKLTRTEAGGQALSFGAIPDQSFLFRDGALIIGEEAAVVGEFTFATLPSAAANVGRMAIVTDLSNALVRAGGSPVQWRPVTGRQCIFRAIASTTPEAGFVVSGATAETDFANSVFVLPAGMLSATGGIDVNATGQFGTTPTAGTIRVRFETSAVYGPTAGATVNYNPRIHIRNRNATNAQFSTGNMTLTSGGGASFLATTIDTSAAVTVKVTAEPGTGAPTATLYFVEYYWVD